MRLLRAPGSATLAAAAAWLAAIVWTVVSVFLGATGLAWLALMLSSAGMLFALWERKPLARVIGLFLAGGGQVVFAVAGPVSTGWFLLPAAVLELVAGVLAMLAATAPPTPRRAAL